MINKFLEPVVVVSWQRRETAEAQNLIPVLVLQRDSPVVISRIVHWAQKILERNNVQSSTMNFLKENIMTGSHIWKHQENVSSTVCQKGKDFTTDMQRRWKKPFKFVCVFFLSVYFGLKLPGLADYEANASSPLLITFRSGPKLIIF